MTDHSKKVASPINLSHYRWLFDSIDARTKAIREQEHTQAMKEREAAQKLRATGGWRKKSRKIIAHNEFHADQQKLHDVVKGKQKGTKHPAFPLRHSVTLAKAKVDATPKPHDAVKGDHKDETVANSAPVKKNDGNENIINIDGVAVLHAEKPNKVYKYPIFKGADTYYCKTWSDLKKLLSARKVTSIPLPNGGVLKMSDRTSPGDYYNAPFTIGGKHVNARAVAPLLGTFKVGNTVYHFSTVNLLPPGKAKAVFHPAQPKKPVWVNAKVADDSGIFDSTGHFIAEKVNVKSSGANSSNKLIEISSPRGKSIQLSAKPIGKYQSLIDIGSYKGMYFSPDDIHLYNAPAGVDVKFTVVQLKKESLPIELVVRLPGETLPKRMTVYVGTKHFETDQKTPKPYLQ